MWRVRARHAVPLLKDEAKAKFKRAGRMPALQGRKYKSRIKGADRRPAVRKAMAKELRTSRSQLDRLLDPRNVSVTLDTITRAARALGKRVVIRIADVKVKRR